jgi:hypothetical protein
LLAIGSPPQPIRNERRRKQQRRMPLFSWIMTSEEVSPRLRSVPHTLSLCAPPPAASQQREVWGLLSASDIRHEPATEFPPSQGMA